MSDVDGDFIRRAWPEGYQAGTEISPYAPYGGLDEYGNLVSWEDQFVSQDMAEMLRRDGRARSLEAIVTLPVRDAPFNITAGKGDKGELEWLKGMLADMPTDLDTCMAWATQSFVFRATFLEKVFAIVGGKLVYQQLAWRPPEACSLIHDKLTGSVLGFQQMLGGPDRFGMVEIPLRKAVVFVHGRNRDAMRGSSDLEVALRCFNDKQKIRYLWMTFLDAASVPRTVASTPPGTETVVTNTLSKLRAGGTASVPFGTEVKALDIAGQAAASFLAALQYLDSEMSASVLAGFTDFASSAGKGSRGSMPVAQAQTTFYAQMLDASAKEVATDFRRQMFAPILQANFGPRAAIPTCVIGPISIMSVQDLMTALQMMAWANAENSLIPPQFVEELVVRTAAMLNLPEGPIRQAIEEQQRQLDAQAPPAAGPTNAIHAGVTVAHNATRQAMAGSGQTGQTGQQGHNAMRRAMAGRGPTAMD